MALFKISKGLKANLPITKTPGYCWFTIDDHLFYIDYEDSNGVIQRAALNAKDAETLTGASLATILNSSDLEIPTSKAVLDAIEVETDRASNAEASINSNISDLSNDLENLDAVVANKASASDLTSHIENKSNPHDVTLSQLGVTVTTTELNYVGGTTSNIQTQIDNKASVIIKEW